MSWPQNPQQPQQPEQPQNPSMPPQGGFGPPPTWGPDGDGHAQPTMISQPAVPPPPGPAQGGAPGAVPPPPPPGPVPGAPGPVPGAPGHVPGAQGPGGPGPVPGPGMAPPPGMPTAPMAQQPWPPQAPHGQAPHGQGPQGQAPYGQGPHGQGPQAGKSNKTLLAVIGGVVALAVIGGGAYFALSGGSGGDDDKKNDKPQAGQSQSQAPAAPGQQQDKPADGGAPADPSAQQPTVAGWQTQLRAEHYFQYDVPGKADKWKVAPTDTAISYTEGGKPVVVMTGTSNYKEGGCSSQPNPDAFGEAGQGQLATVGTTGGGKDGDLKTNARNWAGNWGFMAYGGKDHKPKLEFTDEKEWKRNGIDGWTATAKVTVTNRPSPCVPPTAIVKSIAQKMPDGTFHGWVIYADQGVPDALTEAQIDKIMNTVRPAKGPGA